MVREWEKSMSTEEVINCKDLDTRSKLRSSFFNKSEFSSSLGAKISDASMALTVLLNSDVSLLEENSLFINSCFILIFIIAVVLIVVCGDI